MSKKTYTIRVTRHRYFSTCESKPSEITGTLEELINHFAYTLECGHSYNKKINTNPKTIKSLISNVEKAKQESSRGTVSYCIELV